MQKFSIENIKKTLRGEGGFTLVELLVTVTIIGVLSAVVSVGVGGGATNAQTKANQAKFAQYQAGVDTYLGTTSGATLAKAFGTNGTPATAVTCTGTVCDGLYGADGETLINGSITGTSDVKYTLESADDIATSGALRLNNAGSSVILVFKGTTNTLLGWK